MQNFFSAVLAAAILVASGHVMAQSFGDHGRGGRYPGNPPGGYPGNPPPAPAPNPWPGDGWHRRPRLPGHHFCERAQYNFNQAQFALSIAINNLNNLPSLCGGNPGCIVAYQNIYNQTVTNYQNAQQEVYLACNRRRW